MYGLIPDNRYNDCRKDDFPKIVTSQGHDHEQDNQQRFKRRIPSFHVYHDIFHGPDNQEQHHDILHTFPPLETCEN